LIPAFFDDLRHLVEERQLLEATREAWAEFVDANDLEEIEKTSNVGSLILRRSTHLSHLLDARIWLHHIEKW
jgi:hypothetical protein